MSRPVELGTQYPAPRASTSTSLALLSPWPVLRKTALTSAAETMIVVMLQVSMVALGRAQAAAQFELLVSPTHKAASVAAAAELTALSSYCREKGGGFLVQL